MTGPARVGRDGAVRLPAEARGRAGLFPGTEVEFVVEGGSVRVTPAGTGGGRPGRGAGVGAPVGVGPDGARAVGAVARLLLGG